LLAVTGLRGVSVGLLLCLAAALPTDVDMGESPCCVMSLSGAGIRWPRRLRSRTWYRVYDEGPLLAAMA
jgi:hypothetical protein